MSDLRGNAATSPHASVLEDPTGRRRKRLRLAGRAIAAALTLWLLALVLGGVGLNPVPGVPFAHILKPAAPPKAQRLPKPAQPTVADLQPALPPGSSRTAVAAQPAGVAGEGQTRARAKTAPAARHTPATRQRSVDVHTMGPAADGPQAATQPPATVHPNNGRGRTTTTTPTTTTTTTTTTTSPGRSGTAPGQTHTSPGRSATGTTTSTP